MITPEQMATLLQMARDIYPHDQVGDQFYAVAVKGYDAEDKKDLVAAGIAELDAAAKALGHADYLVDRLGGGPGQGPASRSRPAPSSRPSAAGLVTGLYNQKEIWPIFGYEGESFSQGGYIERGFDDIDWL